MDETTKIIDALIAGGMSPAEAAGRMAKASMEISRQPLSGAERTQRWRDRQVTKNVTNVTQESFLPSLDIHTEEVSKKDSGRDEKCHSNWPADYQDQFWAQCPRRVAKAAAMKALAKVRASGLDWEKFLLGVHRWGAEAAKSDPKYVKHPATWLNAGCWDDEPMPEGPNGQDRSISAAAQRLAQRVEAGEFGGFVQKPAGALSDEGWNNVLMLSERRRIQR